MVRQDISPSQGRGAIYPSHLITCLTGYSVSPSFHAYGPPMIRGRIKPLHLWSLKHHSSVFACVSKVRLMCFVTWRLQWTDKDVSRSISVRGQSICRNSPLVCDVAYAMSRTRYSPRSWCHAVALYIITHSRLLPSVTGPSTVPLFRRSLQSFALTIHSFSSLCGHPIQHWHLLPHFLR